MGSMISRKPLPKNPTVAIIIPCRNEAAWIGTCLDSLLTGTFDLDRTQTLVLDGMSTDGTRQIVTRYVQEHSNIRLIDNPSGTKPSALNIGISMSHSDVVIRIDAHTSYAPDYVERLVHGLAEYNADNIGGVRETYSG